jgi:hypothetical protein
MNLVAIKARGVTGGYWAKMKDFLPEYFADPNNILIIIETNLIPLQHALEPHKMHLWVVFFLQFLCLRLVQLIVIYAKAPPSNHHHS